MYQAMGGITGFTSLVDGVDKLELDEEKKVRRPRLAPGAGGRLMIEEPRADAAGASEREQSRATVRSSPTAAESMVAGDEQKERNLRRGKMHEVDEMALYEQKYKKTMSVRSRTGLQPITPQRLDEDNTRSATGTPRRSSFNTSLTSSVASRPSAATSTSSSAMSSSRLPSSGRSSTAASPNGSAVSSGQSTPRRSSAFARKPAVPVQPARRGSGSQTAAEKK